MPVRPLQAAPLPLRARGHLEGEQEQPARGRDTRELDEDGGEFRIVQGDGRVPGQGAAELIDPTSKRSPEPGARSPGCAPRATATIPGERSMPNTSAPSPADARSPAPSRTPEHPPVQRCRVELRVQQPPSAATVSQERREKSGGPD
ncbi:hypothetical protein HHL19_17035 [Streptomyces sp. R302]|uniref:hypothetical protein n=1 Tax=Streptomyces sp. R302 TaxID=2728844 RepID=UPI00145DA07D|nr:hypothetical protein [Streptomyces sp. R302]NML52731.1 hypothetical protein [Streptomyces sp. R301]NML80340.1 hypothetical protein [Streptomyces sp. R302]